MTEDVGKESISLSIITTSVAEIEQAYEKIGTSEAQETAGKDIVRQAEERLKEAKSRQATLEQDSNEDVANFDSVCENAIGVIQDIRKRVADQRKAAEEGST